MYKIKAISFLVIKRKEYLLHIVGNMLEVGYLCYLVSSMIICFANTRSQDFFLLLSGGLACFRTNRKFVLALLYMGEWKSLCVTSPFPRAPMHRIEFCCTSLCKASSSFFLNLLWCSPLYAVLITHSIDICSSYLDCS